MLPSKLFTALAIVFAVFAGLAYLNPFPSVDLSVRGAYWVLGPELVLLFCMVTSANFAVLYCAGDRFFHVRWNRGLSLLHVFLFLCFAIGFSIVFAISTRAANDRESGDAIRWMMVPRLLGIFGLVASFAVFAVNLALTVVHLLRARFARQ
jgi:heme/copper-type cytochrome/quinol oxidase subunit 1